ncbi:MAG TPA: hypothetical protein VMD49_05645 [Steroidobacteraceae bacterium]|nr:hypothetical protein [Steroidobacteraceae bacterium]
MTADAPRSCGVPEGVDPRGHTDGKPVLTDINPHASAPAGHWYLSLGDSNAGESMRGDKAARRAVKAGLADCNACVHIVTALSVALPLLV